jgi:hypothetical protein
MAGRYKETGLWKQSLANSKCDGHDQECLERLRTVYEKFRARASQLTSQIQVALPDLTIHDVTHLDALWETADLIAGPKYPLNPMEGFVLGGAILLHDSALCFEAYEDGADGLRNSIEWRDAYASAEDKNATDREADWKKTADFAALRNLHAKQASYLGEKAWRTPEGDNIYLIDDSELRNCYGKLIGLIAASHHWSTESVNSKLPKQINAPSGFPREWRVDPVKIACLLRCADAAHIDDRRAPDFLRALTHRQGISADHWTAQNWLARADLDQSDSEGCSLLFTSQRNFGADHVDAWWVAYDAIQLVDSEIKTSNALLESRDQSVISPPFKVKRVSGTSSPEAMSEYIRVEGWKPCSAKIHVGNIESLVKTLGGTSLYGEHDTLSVALRELIQNARDAVVARREMQSEYVGKIRIQVRRAPTGETVIDVIDDGSGMSERVLTGPLLDFGTSFWISDLVQEEFPGLRSSRFQPVGRFGIGFYSVFMVASKVYVSTRRWDAARSDVLTLSFPKGLTLRPTLSKERPVGFDESTVITCILKDDISEPFNIKITTGLVGASDFYVSFANYLASLVAGLDTRVELRLPGDDSWHQIHNDVSSLKSYESRHKWLEQISFDNYLSNSSSSRIDEPCGRLRFIYNGIQPCGLAALSTTFSQPTSFLSVQTIGGLATTVHARHVSGFIGYLDYNVISAKRNSGTSLRASHEAIVKWAGEQLSLLKEGNTDSATWCAATYSLCDLDLDPLHITHAALLVDGSYKIINIHDIFELIKARGIAIYKSRFMDHVETNMQISQYESYPTFIPVRNGRFLNLEFSDDAPKAENSFVGCIYRYALSKKISLKKEIRKSVMVSFLGPVDAMIITVATCD